MYKKIDNGSLAVDRAYKEVQDQLWKEKQIANCNELALKFEKSSQIQLLEGDFKDVAFKELKNDSIDLVFTDPPYDRKSLPLYEDLAKLAVRVLRPGGSLIMYLGQHALVEIIDRINYSATGELTYWWQFCILHEGPFARYFDRQIVVKWKPLLWFVKGNRPINPSFPKAEDSKKNFLSDLIISNKPEKRFHEWGQSPADSEHVIKFLTAENDLVLDPFLGGGSTAISCLNLRRRFIGIDINPNSLEAARIHINLKFKTSEVKVR